MNLNKAFVAAVAFPFALLAGCGSGQGPEAAQATIQRQNPGEPIKLEKIAHGRFFTQEDGVYKLTIPAQKAGTPNDLNCIVGVQNSSSENAKATWSCDFIAAHGLNIKAP